MRRRGELGGDASPPSSRHAWTCGRTSPSGSGTTVPYQAFTFLFEDTPHGLYRVHAYRFHEQGSTFIVECREDTWRAAGFADASGNTTVKLLEDIFHEELGGQRLSKNPPPIDLANFPTVRCGKWHAGNVVLMGTRRTPPTSSIGSGTKLAMEDSIALRDDSWPSPVARSRPRSRPTRRAAAPRSSRSRPRRRPASSGSRARSATST
ncbi:MAG: hypothetical protein IPQ07_20840 [Myxococcales bacterium]|nr:hypothetical protein [Myxococcales bacterium]